MTFEKLRIPLTAIPFESGYARAVEKWILF